MFSVTCWWCWPFVPCSRRGPACHSSSAQGHPQQMTIHIHDAAEAHSAEVQRLAHRQLQVPVISAPSLMVVFLVSHALLSLPEALRSCKSFLCRSGRNLLSYIPLKALLILRCYPTQARATEHSAENVGQKLRVKYRLYRNRQFCQKGALSLRLPWSTWEQVLHLQLGSNLSNQDVRIKVEHNGWLKPNH